MKINVYQAVMIDKERNNFVHKKKLIKTNHESITMSQKMKIKTTKMSSFIALSDAISLLNMISGFLSILLSINGNLKYAAILMFFSLLFDSVDGWVARKINRNDSYGFGKNIDSLSDIVSFGVAPAVLLYQLSDSSFIGIGVSMLMMICGVLRLTRYNAINDHIDFNGFIGFPIPGISLIISSYYLSGLFNIYIAYMLMVITSIMMISNAKYKKLNNNALILTGAILVLLLILQIPLVLFGINIPAICLLIICLYYLLSCLFNKL